MVTQNASLHEGRNVRGPLKLVTKIHTDRKTKDQCMTKLIVNRYKTYNEEKNYNVSIRVPQ